MKLLSVFFTLLVAMPSFARAQEVLHPTVAFEFGKQLTVQAEFVAKPNDYYSQNLVPEPYMLKVVAANGTNLKESVLIEYKLQTDERKRATIERPGVVVTFEAYESVYQPSLATPWLAPAEQGMGFVLIHVLHIRPKEKGNKSGRVAPDG